MRGLESGMMGVLLFSDGDDDDCKEECGVVVFIKFLDSLVVGFFFIFSLF